MPLRRMLSGLLCVVALVVGASAPAADKASEKETPEQVLAGMKKQLGDGFHYRTVRCFAVASDAPAETLERYCEHTLGACYDAYEKQFFRTKPTEVFRMYLFKDAASYQAHTKSLWNYTPDTPFGYYSPAIKSLVMNIGTGGGTLVHEMFHALVRSDFPDIPAWANEGIASLFEQCDIGPEGLIGLVNWRLPILQESIRKDELSPLRKIMTFPDQEFYKGRSGNYAAARYFMLYLQEQFKLVDFYRKFRDGYARDKTGVKFAEEVLGKKLEDFEPGWRAWVMGLKR